MTGSHFLVLYSAAGTVLYVRDGCGSEVSHRVLIAEKKASAWGERDSDGVDGLGLDGPKGREARRSELP